MRRIVLERGLRRSQLPPYAEIDNAPIRDAAAARDAATVALNEAKRTEIDLEQTRPRAEQADAEACEQARHEGKPDPKRTHVAAHDKKLDAARHEHRVAVYAEDRAFNDLQTTLDEHQGEWVESLERDAAVEGDEWQELMNAAIALHAKRSRTLAIRAIATGEPSPPIAGLRFPARAIRELEIASGQQNPHGVIEMGDVLARLANLGKPEPEPEPTEPPLRLRNASENESDGGVQREQQERRAFAERMAREREVADAALAD